MDPIGFVSDVIQNIISFFQGLAPGGFGLILLPLGILALITVLVARKR